MFSVEHHGMLFAFFARSIMTHRGEKSGERLIRKAVREYGCQRGRRMARHALSNGHSLNFINYFVYGEWEVPPGDMVFTFTRKTPHLRMVVRRCPWHEMWKKAGLLSFGKYYCMEIDAALVAGFNPLLTIRIQGTQTTGHECCDFFFKDANLTFLNQLAYLYRKNVRPGRSAVRSWAYHTAHLFHVLEDVVKKESAQEAGRIIDDVSRAFSETYSHAHLDDISGIPAGNDEIPLK